MALHVYTRATARTRARVAATVVAPIHVGARNKAMLGCNTRGPCAGKSHRVGVRQGLFVRLLRLVFHSMERKVLVESVVQVTIAAAISRIATVRAVFVQWPVVVLFPLWFLYSTQVAIGGRSRGRYGSW